MVSAGKHKGLPVPGYRPQSSDAVQLVSKSKQVEEMVLRFLDALGADPKLDLRWLSIGRTHIEQGFMAVNRSVFRPDRVEFPEEDANG